MDALDLYALKSINRLESEFLSLVDFNLFVSAEMYTKYYCAVREISKPTTYEKFNRFKKSDKIDTNNTLAGRLSSPLLSQ